MSDWNTAIIEEFRHNGGKCGGMFEGAPLLILHTTGAKTGQERVMPLMYQARGDDLVIFASKAGAPTNPDWFHNLVAHPQASVEVGTDTVAVTARVAEGDEREQIWTEQKAAYANFAEYEAATTRTIPVVILSRAV